MKALYMSLRQAIACVLVFLPSTGVSAQSAPIGPPRNSIVIRVGHVLDVRSGTYVKDAAVYIEGERIKAVGPATDVLKQAPTTAGIIDLGDATVLPGLIDCHTHLMARIPDDKYGYGLNLLTKSPHRGTVHDFPTRSQIGALGCGRLPLPGAASR